MIKRHLTVAVCTLFGCLSGNSARAQFSGDNQTITISGVSNGWAAQFFYIGDTNSGDQLQIVNDGVQFVTNGYDAYIGYVASADGNSLVVSGSGSAWIQLNSGGLFVGYYGSSNSLTVSSGAEVIAALNAGAQPGANNNSVVVTGTGSVLSITFDWETGDYGSANSLVISGGGAIDGGHRIPQRANSPAATAIAWWSPAADPCGRILATSLSAIQAVAIRW